MKAPEQDLANRMPVWDAMQTLFMDTHPEDWLEHIAGICAESGYTLEELEAILFNEVLPACSANLLALPGGEWRGFEEQALQDLVLDKHRFGKRKPFLHRGYASDWWRELAPMISEKLEQAVDA
jgi:hypothetical protein